MRVYESVQPACEDFEGALANHHRAIWQLSLETSTSPVRVVQGSCEANRPPTAYTFQAVP